MASELPDRELLVATLRSDLVRYLSDAADRTTGVTGIRDVFALAEGDLERAIAYRVATSPEASSALTRVQQLLPVLPPARARVWRETQGYVRGNVSWYRTVQRRIASGDPTIFVAAVPEKRYDTAFARLVRLTLELFVAAVRRSKLQLSKQDAPTPTDFQRSYTWAARHLRHPKLSGLGSLREQDLIALGTREQAAPLLQFVRLAQATLERSDSSAISSLMESVLLVPRSTPTLYELFVGFRLIDELEALGYVRERPWSLLGGKSPLAILTKGDRRVTVHWQRSIGSVEKRMDSLLGQVALENGTVIGAARPDLVLELERPGERRIRFAEVKYYTKPNEGLQAGLVQALGYVKDAESLFAGDEAFPIGLVIAAGARAHPAPSLLSLGSHTDLGTMARHLLESF